MKAIKFDAIPRGLEYWVFTSFFKFSRSKKQNNLRRPIHKGNLKENLDCEDLFRNKRDFVIPRRLSKLHLAKLTIEKCDTTSSFFDSANKKA